MKFTFVLESCEVSGGVRIVLSLAGELNRRGHRAWIVSRTPPPDWYPMDMIPFLEVHDLDPERFPEADVGIATFYTTIDPVSRCRKFARKAHLCQGYEGIQAFLSNQKEAIERAYSTPMERWVVAPHLAEIIRSRHGIEAHTIGQFLNHKDFHPSPTPLLPARLLRMAVVGYFEAEFKGVSFILKTLSDWQGNFPFEVFRVSLTPITEEERDLKVTDTFFRGLSHREMGNLYRSCHLMVHAPDTTEGFGLPPLEAALCGCIPVVSDIPSYKPYPALPRFPARDPDALRDLLTEIVKDPVCFRESLAPLQEQLQTMTVERVTDRLMERLSVLT
ncbi:MAG TPA: glycosyltransferase [Thermoanaerobaculia bacterium]|nr:glycosyltransferase [Thermoanaerobaculia bacterium]HUM30510.1 glycosyltransferase [Thermoanaerobaculia bacterium]HXK68702.1 glycosyltransferase [Thermoanaerobaculia bacterium]